GPSFSGTVAPFSDANPNAGADASPATVPWGDGQPSAGTVVPGDTSGFVVTASHAYTQLGNFAVSVLIQDAAGASATASSTANAGGLSLLEGQLYSGPVATGSGSMPGGSVSINWGDGTTNSAGALKPNRTTY